MNRKSIRKRLPTLCLKPEGCEGERADYHKGRKREKEKEREREREVVTTSAAVLSPVSRTCMTSVTQRYIAIYTLWSSSSKLTFIYLHIFMQAIAKKKKKRERERERKEGTRRMLLYLSCMLLLYAMAQESLILFAHHGSTREQKLWTYSTNSIQGLGPKRTWCTSSLYLIIFSCSRAIFALLFIVFTNLKYFK